MSRAYRIRVSESLTKVLRAHDKVSTQLEVLEILPREQMGELLEKELEDRGFKRKGGNMVRSEGGVTVTVDTREGTVTVQAQGCEEVKLQTEKSDWGYDDAGPRAKKIRKDLQAKAHQELEKQAQAHEANLQSEVTDKLEGQLVDLKQELDQVVNKVTGEALKQKAAQLGQIKELTEDPQTGSMTIVLEV
jgi:hypothetical protein